MIALFPHICAALGFALLGVALTHGSEPPRGA